MEKGEKKVFQVKGSKVAGAHIYFQVSYQGQEFDIKAFEFQRKSRPTQLHCIVKGFTESGSPIFMQDIAAILPQIYTIGESYEFRVKTDLICGKYYEVADWNGLIFRLSNPHIRERLHVNEVVRCRVKAINLVRMELELESNHQRGIPLFSLDEFLSLDSSGQEADHYLRYLFARLPQLGDARDQLKSGNPLWVMTAADTVARNFTEWLSSDFRRDESPMLTRQRRDRRTREQRLRVLSAFNSICINLLENSKYLRACTPRERMEYQDRLNKIITHTGDYLRALRLIVDKKDQIYIDETLERLKLSGYLYNPEERMRVAMALFSLRKDSVSNYIDDIFDIIRDSHSNHRFMHLFARAFVDMLDMYISNGSRHMDLLTSGTERTAIIQMIKALSLRLLLFADTDDMKSMYRSMLYRYVTLVTRVDDGKLMEKSLSVLFGEPGGLEMTWAMLNDINMLCSRLAVGGGGTLSTDTYVYEGNNALMTINGSSLTFTPVMMGQTMRNAIPTTLFGRREIKVLLNERLDEKPGASCSDIMQYRRMWRDVERSLFAVNQKMAVKTQGLTPDVGDIVTIRIIGRIQGRKYDYRAVIEDPVYAGEGIITPKGIVSYPIQPLSDTFVNRDTGDECLYKATVESRDENGNFVFNMRQDIHDFLRDNLEIGSLCLLQVSMIQPDRYLCISESGFSCFMYRNEVEGTLSVGDFIDGRIEEIFPNPVIRVSYEGRSDASFLQTEALKWLLDEYCGDCFYTSDHEDEDHETEVEEARAARNFIDADEMRELIHIVDREGMLCTDHIVTYSYLAVARIMSMIIGDAHMTSYFTNRMELVETICLFGENGRIDDDRLEKLLSDNREFVSSYPDIENRLTRLRIINTLDKPWRADWLWQLACGTPDETTSHLARLVLSYNMLADSNIYEARASVRRKIYQLMELKLQVPDNERVAQEDQFTELKTSIIYPAGKHMLPAEREQMTEILKVISSFLNSRGGRLLVGVDDSGYAVGLHNDFTYLNNRHEKYDLADVKDKFDRTVRDNVRNRLGRVANSRISGSFETIGTKTIYRLDIEPSPEVALVDGVAYERQGSSKWPVPAADLEAFTAARREEFA